MGSRNENIFIRLESYEAKSYWFTGKIIFAALKERRKLKKYRWDNSSRGEEEK